MTTIFVPFDPSHIERIKVQEEQVWELTALTQEHLESLTQNESWSAFNGERCLGCAGILDLPGWPHRSVAWALVGASLGRSMVPVVRFAREFLQYYPVPRVETYVDCEFEEGHRFAEMLGFKLEAPRMVKYGHDGRDMALYARTL